MKPILVSLGLLVVAATFGCDNVGVGSKVRGSGVAKTETREVAEFDQIDFRGQGNIAIAIGELQPLEITADDNILPLIETTVTGGRLVIQTTKPIRPEVSIVIKMSAPNIKSITGSGAANIEIEGVKNESLQIDLAGAGRVVAQGETGTLQITISGAGDIQAANLIAREVKVALNGTGNADVHAVEKLDASIAGIGSISYSGDPVVTKDIAGIGSLTKKD